MNQLSGVETEGVLCDLCHKIGDVTLNAETGLPHQSLAGVPAYRLYRPAAGTQIFFGTLDDIPRRVSYSPLEKESSFSHRAIAAVGGAFRPTHPTTSRSPARTRPRV